MKRIDRFILKSYFGPMILTFFIVMFILMMNVVWRYIDELVGKGLDVGVISELMLYAVINMIPMGLPLATLLAAIMTMGNLGENYELLAMRSCGMSLTRILKPLLIVIFFISIGSFFVANNMVPYSNKKMHALLWDIRQQKQTIEFKDGLFFNGIPNLSIRVEQQDPNSGLLKNVLIYNNSNMSGNMSTIIADSGYISLSDDRRYLLVTLYNGESFDQTRNYQWYTKSELTRNYFEEQNMVMPTSGFAFSRTDAELFSNSGATKTIVELEHGIDSLAMELRRSESQAFKPFFNNIFTNETKMVADTVLRYHKGYEFGSHEVIARDSIDKIDNKGKLRLWSNALSTARIARNSFSFEEDMSKSVLDELNRFKGEWHKKLSLPVSVMIFFIIGASLGAIIRKGGLGMPVVVSILFFVIYYVISIAGEKMAREGAWPSVAGMWLSTYILFPLAVFLLYKANKDSNLFNADWYLVRVRRGVNFAKSTWKKIKNRDNDTKTASIQ